MLWQAQNAQASINRPTEKLLRLIDGWLKAYGKKQKDHRIVVKVDGKVKFKATVDKNGKLNINHNTLTPEEIKALQNYFKSIPNPVVNPKDFDVIVDDQTVLKTENGEVVERAQSQEPNAFDDVEAKQADEPAEDEPEKKPEPEEAPRVNETGPVAEDFGLGIPITAAAILATGDRDLLSDHHSLEAKRLELNYCDRRGSEAGMEPLQKRAEILRAEINRDLPKFSEQIKTLTAQGKYDPAKRSAPGLDHDMPLTPKQAQTEAPKAKAIRK